MKLNKSHGKGLNGDLFSNKYFFKIILSHTVTYETFPSQIFTTCRSEVLECFKYDNSELRVSGVYDFPMLDVG